MKTSLKISVAVLLLFLSLFAAAPFASVLIAGGSESKDAKVTESESAPVAVPVTPQQKATVEKAPGNKSPKTGRDSRSLQQIMDLRKLVGSALEGTILEGTDDDSAFKDALEAAIASEQPNADATRRPLPQASAQPQASTQPRAYAQLGSPAPTQPVPSRRPSGVVPPKYPYYTPSQPPRDFFHLPESTTQVCPGPNGAAPTSPLPTVSDSVVAGEIRAMARRLEAMANSYEDQGQYEKADSLRDACHQMRQAARMACVDRPQPAVSAVPSPVYPPTQRYRPVR